MSTPISVGSDYLDKLRRREPETLNQAVRDHARPLSRAARAMGFSSSEAEDLSQDVFVTFLERLDQFEGKSQLRTWLFGILHFKMLERRRALALDSRNDTIDEIFESHFDANGSWQRPPADLERLLISKESGVMIQNCLEGLTANQREAFVLREIEEICTGDICKILGLTVTNFGVLIHRARARLRHCLEAKGLNRP